MKPKRILMPTDFSDCAATALALAVSWAEAFGAELHLLHVAELHASGTGSGATTDDRFPNDLAIATALAQAAATAAEARLAEAAYRPFVIRQEQRRAITSAPTIVDYANEEDIDLIVMGTHGGRALRRLVLGSVAQAVVRDASCPVMTVRDDGHSETFGSLARIVVPTDFSPGASHALAAARSLARHHGCHIDLVHVIPPQVPVAGIPPAGPVLGGAPIAGSAHFGTAEACRLRLEQEALAVELDLSVECHVLDGPPAPTIADFARERQAGLIVIGSQGLRGFQRFVLGSVSERVVRAAPCPVLVTRPSNTRSDYVEHAEHAAI